MSECALCDLPTPDPPVTESDVDGEYCCRGCLEVGRRLDDVAAADPDSLDPAAVDSAVDADADSVPDGAETAYLDVDGLHCSACELFLEAEAASEDGVFDADVSYATDAARVAYDPETVAPADLPGLFDRLGYGASLPDDEASEDDGWLGDDLRVVAGSLLGMVVMLGYGLVLYGSYLDLAPTTELAVLAATLALGTVYCAVTFALVFGLLEAVVLLAALQSVSFAAILNADALSVGSVVPAVAALATVVVFYTGRPFLRGAYVSLRAGRPNMDLLVALAVLAAWGYSVAAYAAGSAHVYFDVAVMVVLVVTLGNRIEERVKSRAVSGLSAFAAARVEEARRRTADSDGDATETIPVEALDSGDEVVVRAGERVPVDGTVAEGVAAVDESLVTGESVPDTKRPGDEVVGGTVVTDDALVVEVGEGGGSTADRLVELLWDVRSSRPGVQQVADRLAAVFVPLVVALAVATAGYYLWSGASAADAVLTGVAVLVVSCPCALGLATPLAVSAGVREALDAGVVVTDAGVFERVRDVDAVVLDKTGTLTTGEMAVEDVTTADGTEPETVLARAAAVEQFSTHPVAAAVTDRADPPAGDVTDFDRKPRGVAGTVGGNRVLVGHPGLFADWTIPDDLDAAIEASESDGVATVVGWDGEARGVLTVADQPRDEWLSVVEDLAAGGREVVVLTGDDPEAAAPFREHDAVSDVFAGVPPEGKAQTVQAVGEDATVAMVGDGSNDAPALAAADLGVAMGSGTELAADAADAVVTTDLAAAPELFGIADAARSRIRQNLAWAFTYNAVAIPLAVAALLNPLFAAVAMAGSSLVVVGNSARPLRGGLLSGFLSE